MQLIYTTLGVLVGLALLAAIGLGAYWGLAWTVGLFTRLDPQVAAVTGILSALALLVAMIVAGSRDRAARPVRAGQIEAERVRAYALFLDLWERLIQGRPEPGGEDAQVAADALRQLDLDLSLYGCAKALKAHRTLRVLLATGRLGSPDARATLVAALVEIRKDLGSDSRDLTPVDLTSAIFPDWAAPESSARAATPAASAPATSAQREAI